MPQSEVEAAGGAEGAADAEDDDQGDEPVITGEMDLDQALAVSIVWLSGNDVRFAVLVWNCQ